MRIPANVQLEVHRLGLISEPMIVFGRHSFLVEALAAVDAAGAAHVVALTDRIDGAGTTPGAGSSASTSQRGPTCSRATRPRCSRSMPPAPSSPGGSSTPTPICRAVARARRSRPDPRERGEPGMTAIRDIPSTSAAPEQPRPSAVVARLRGYRPSRRTVLRALVLGAAASTLVPLDWYLSRRQASAEPSNRSSTAPASPRPTTRRPTTGGRAARRSATAAGSAVPTRARTATTARAPQRPRRGLRVDASRPPTATAATPGGGRASAAPTPSPPRRSTTAPSTRRHDRRLYADPAGAGQPDPRGTGRRGRRGRQRGRSQYGRREQSDAPPALVPSLH